MPKNEGLLANSMFSLNQQGLKLCSVWVQGVNGSTDPASSFAVSRAAHSLSKCRISDGKLVQHREKAESSIDRLTPRCKRAFTMVGHGSRWYTAIKCAREILES